MEKMKYSDKLKDPRWQKKRLEIFERDGWKCMACGEKDKTLHIHHIFYLPKKEPWEIPNGFLITFCEDCHNPTGCNGQDCNSCDEDCDGAGNHPEDIQNAIATLLNTIWENDNIGDYFTALGFVNSRVR
jgi:hypothetical protein